MVGCLLLTFIGLPSILYQINPGVITNSRRVHAYWQLAEGLPVEGHAPLTMIYPLLILVMDRYNLALPVSQTPLTGESMLE